MRYVELNGTADEVAAVICRFRSGVSDSASTTVTPGIRKKYKRRLSTPKMPDTKSSLVGRPIGRPKGVKNGQGKGRARDQKFGRGPDVAVRKKKRLVNADNARRGWSVGDERLLKRFRQVDNIEFRAIGKRLGRSTKACRERMNRMRQEGRWD